MQLRPTLLPVPVEPAISRWGMRGEVGRPDVAVHGLAEAEREPARGAAEGVGLEHLAQVDRLAHLVRDLDADVALAAHAVDADRLGLERQRQVVGEADDLRVLDAGVGLELVGGDHGPGVDLAHRAHHAELGRLQLQDLAALEQAVVVELRAALGLVEDGERGQRVAAARLGGGGGRRPAAARRRRDAGRRRLGLGRGRLCAAAAAARGTEAASARAAPAPPRPGAAGRPPARPRSRRRARPRPPPSRGGSWAAPPPPRA